MWRTWVAGAWVLLAAMGCGAPPPERADAAALIDLPEASVYWQLDAFAVPDSGPRPDVGRADRPVVNPCDGGLTRCLGTSTCVDVQTDRENCGACNATCDDRSECSGGRCTQLPGDEAICGGERVHLTTDTRHCGGCGRTCDVAGLCIDGNCEGECRGGSLRCSGLAPCIDIQSDEAHCGACDNACQAGETCHEGACLDPCSVGSLRCPGSGACLDLQTDSSNCGVCARRCPSGTACDEGVCVARCVEGETRCAPRGCVNLQEDVRNCGGCGITCASEHAVSSLCREGACEFTCEVGYVQCGEPRPHCVLLPGTDTANCGACGRACEAGERCVTGECIAPGARPISPLSGTLNASRRPRFRWAPPPDGGAVVVEVCAARDCRTVEGSQTVAMGNELRWPTALSPGPHWWRVRRPGGGRVATAVWEVFIPETDSPVPLVGAPRSDFNSDGVIDPATEAAYSVGDVNGDGFVDSDTRLGSPVGLIGMRPVGGSEPGSSTRAVGDTNGDGYADQVMTVGRSGGTISPWPTETLWLGGPSSDMRSRLHLAGGTWSSVIATDFNGDNVEDIVVTLPNSSCGGPYPPFISYRCGPTGGECVYPRCGDVDLLTSGFSFIAGWSDDFNHDGYPDLVIQRFYWDGSPTSEFWTWLGGPDGLTASRCSVTSSAP